MDIRKYNKEAWDAQVRRGNRWTVPVSSEEIERARNGDWEVVLTPSKSVPRSWFGELAGAHVLCLASGGGQQGPILAAAGAAVTVFDNSPAQLGQDRTVADRDDLHLITVEGDMRDLRVFDDRSFDLIFHPCSNSFVPNVNPVWREAFRVLRPGGRLLAGFTNPLVYIFDYQAIKAGRLEVRHQIPYSDLTSLDDDERNAFIDEQEPMCFGHSLEDQIGGQIAAGFAITGFYEDAWEGDSEYARLSEVIPTFAATKADRLSAR